MKTGTATPNKLRKFRQIYRGKSRQISVKYTKLIKLIIAVIAGGDSDHFSSLKLPNSFHLTH